MKFVCVCIDNNIDSNLARCPSCLPCYTENIINSDSMYIKKKIIIKTVIINFFVLYALF